MIIERTIPYEILIRLGAAGYQAAQVIDLEQLFDDQTGEVRGERELPARAISVENAGAILGEANVKLLAQIDALTTALTAETARADQAQEALNALTPAAPEGEGV